MRHLFLLLLLTLPFSRVHAQFYFPPLTGVNWSETDPADLGWCEDSIQQLYNYLDATNTKGFIVLKDGKIVLEKYFDTFTKDSVWVWNSAGKTLTAFAVGIAQEEGYLSISDTTAHHIGAGWTSLTTQQEEKITIRHQLTMTTGLDDGVADIYCTEPQCLQYEAEPGTRWAYHNGPYTLLDTVLEAATGLTLNQWVTQKVKNPTGMIGAYFQSGYNNVFVSDVRSMARFGLLLQAGGVWNGSPVLDDPAYFYEMTHSSQTINPAYGYLTWLNGQSSFMIPQSQLNFPGTAMPNAPQDLFAALGKNSQIINISPSEGLVVVRMGEADGNSLVSIQYNDTIWQYINRLSCVSDIEDYSMGKFGLHPNPTSDNPVTIEGWEAGDAVWLMDLSGKLLPVTADNGLLNLSGIVPGIYLLRLERKGTSHTFRLQIN